jgi:hypothetical protein
MLAAKVERPGHETGSDVRNVVQELSQRLTELRDSAPPASARPRVATPTPSLEPARPATEERPQSAELALVRAALEAERQRGAELRGEISDLIAEVALLEEESRRVAQLRADREQWAGRARAFAASVL